MLRMKRQNENNKIVKPENVGAVHTHTHTHRYFKEKNINKRKNTSSNNDSTRSFCAYF